MHSADGKGPSAHSKGHHNEGPGVHNNGHHHHHEGPGTHHKEHQQERAGAKSGTSLHAKTAVTSEKAVATAESLQEVAEIHAKLQAALKQQVP